MQQLEVLPNSKSGFSSAAITARGVGLQLVLLDARKHNTYTYIYIYVYIGIVDF
jgi:hypothetical protein